MESFEEIIQINIKDSKEFERKGLVAGIVGILSNTLLFIIKIIVAIILCKGESYER